MTVTCIWAFPIYRSSLGRGIPYLNFHLLQIRKAALRGPKWYYVGDATYVEEYAPKLFTRKESQMHWLMHFHACLGLIHVRSWRGRVWKHRHNLFLFKAPLHSVKCGSLYKYWGIRTAWVPQVFTRDGWLLQFNRTHVKFTIYGRQSIIWHKYGYKMHRIRTPS